MSDSEINNFFSMSEEEQLSAFNNFSFEKRKDFFQQIDLEKKKFFLEQMTLDDLRKFLSFVNYDYNIVSYISSNKALLLFKSFTDVEKDAKLLFFKTFDSKGQLFEELSSDEKRELLNSLSVKEVDQFFYLSNPSVRNSIYQMLSPDYIKENISNFSLRSARIIMGQLDFESKKLEADIRVYEGQLQRLKDNDKDNDGIQKISSSISESKDNLKVKQECLKVSNDGQKENNDLLSQAVSDFSVAVKNLRNKISRDSDDGFKRIGRLVRGEEDFVRVIYQNGSISESFFNKIVENFNDEEKKVFYDFMINANSIMAGKGKVDGKKDDRDDEKKNDKDKDVNKKVELPKIKNGILFDNYIVKAAEDLYVASGYSKNANGWYFDPSSDDYVEDYNPVYDPTFNVFIREENRLLALKEYETSGYSKNANGWYFDPNSDDYVEDYDPTLDSLFNKSLKPIQKSKTVNTVEKLIAFLNKNQDKFNASFVNSESLKNSDSLLIDGKPIIVISEKDKKIFMEFVGWKNSKKDSSRIKKTVDKIISFVENSKDFDVTFTSAMSFYSLNSLITIKDNQGITSLTDYEKELLKKTVIYQMEVEDKLNNNRGHSRNLTKPNEGNISYQLIIAIIVLLLLVFGIIFFR